MSTEKQNHRPTRQQSNGVKATKAVLIGLAITAVLTAIEGYIAHRFNGDWVTRTILVAIVMIVPAICVGWWYAFPITRAKNAEQNIENTWFDQAGQGAFLDVMVWSVIAALAFTWLSVMGIDLPAIRNDWLLIGVFLFGIIDFAIRYVVLRKGGQ